MLKRVQTAEAEVASLRRDLDEARRERDEAIGIGPGMNDGPFTHCRNCNRRMVWQSADHPCPTWLCPQCVLRRLNTAEAELVDRALSPSTESEASDER